MKKLIIVISLIIVNISSYAQKDSFYVEKRQCQNNYKGNKLSLHYKNGEIHKESFTYGYDLLNFTNLNDSNKLVLIGELLKYENDTSHCCMPLMDYNLNGNEGCRGVPKNVRQFTIQVDALFMINRLVWPKLMELYSCSPVLYDNKLKKEINSDQKKIKLVFLEYKKWYDECKAKGKIPKFFPFNNGRYIWYGGRKSISKKWII